MAELGSIILRRGTTAERLAFVPLKGEIIYDTETKQVYVGDGEKYGGNNVFNEQLVVDDDSNLKVGNNLAVIIDDNGEAKSLRLPGGDKKDRPNPVEGSLRYNKNDKVVEYADGQEWFFLNKTVINGDVVELYVSLDGHDDRRYGVQRGRSWGTAFRTLNSAMRLAEDIITANPETENFVNEEQPIKTKQILVHVASGIYEEHLPIKVPENTSIFGSGQRRTTVRPKIGVPSESPWAKIRFWRETDEFPDGYFGYHYLTDPRSEYSTPRDNLYNDVFLCNSTNWFHDYTTDKHSSFAFVLDPEGQILTKSPYPHTGACFPKSSYDTDPYAVGFHGGIFADGFTGNQEFNIDSVAGDNLSMVASSFWRKPLMPTAFYADGNRYQAQSVTAPSDAKVNATTLLAANKSFIQEETITYVNNTYLFDYNRDKCKRDLQFILKASSYDSILGTNYFGRVAALSYTRPNSAYVLSDQLAPTIGGLTYAKGQANTALSDITAVQQANASIFDDVIDVLNNGAGNVDNLFFPATVYDDAKDYASAIIAANKTFIQAETVEFIRQAVLAGTEPFTTDYVYDQTKCERDIGFLLDALRFDLMFDVNVRGTFLTSQAVLPHLQESAKAGRNPHILTLSPPLSMKAKWFRNHVAYTMAKYGMSMCVLGMAEEFKREKIAVNALWPRTAIDTAALAMIPGVDTAACRTPEILADAAYIILNRESASCSGNFFVDDEVLASEGITDLEKYSVVPGTTDFLLDFFLD